MEEIEGNKRRARNVGEDPEQAPIQHKSGGADASKKVFMRETPKWLPHATANKPKGQKKEGGSPSRRLEHGADRIQTISDSQRKFAAQFSLSAAEKEAEGEENVRIRSGNRWASKPGHSQKCPGGSRWSIEYQPQGSVGGPATVSRMPQEAQTNGSLSRSDVCDKGRLQSDHPEGAQTDQKKDYAKMELGQESEGLVFGGRVRADEEAKGERWSKECDPTDGGKNKPKISAWSKATAGLVKGPWTKEEDQKIINCITKNITKWSEIAERVEGRVGKQCRERWFNHLDPSLKKSSWISAEDEILVQGQARYGNSWTKIAKLLPGRSENAVKNRWNSAARKKGNSARNCVADLAKTAMSNELEAGRQMQYLAAPSSSTSCHLKVQSTAYTGWSVPSTDVRGLIHPALQTFAAQQHGIDQHSPVHDTSRPLSSGGEHGQSLGQGASSRRVYGKLLLSQAGILMSPRMPLGTGNQSRASLTPLSPPRNTSIAGPDSGLTNDSHIAMEVAGKRELAPAMFTSPPRGQPSTDAKDETFFPEDELSLSNTLFSLSLESGFTGSFGRVGDVRQQPDGIGGLFDGHFMLENSDDHSNPRGVEAGFDFNCGAASAPFGGRELRSHVSIGEAYRPPQLATTTSVSDLLFTPTELRMEAPSK